MNEKLIEILSKSDEEILEDAVEIYGTEAQLRQLQEECAELIVAVNHYLRKHKEKDSYGGTMALMKIIEEVADVEIMIAQLPEMFEEFREAADGVKEEKLTRLAVRLEKKKMKLKE